MKKSLFYSLLLLSVLIVNSATADIIRIPDDEETLQAALDRAEEGDTLLVADGEYSGDGNVNLQINIPLTIMSENGPDECIINCEEVEGTIGFDIRTTAVLSGFTVVNPDAAGIRTESANNILIDNCVVTGSDSTGFHIQDCGEVTIANCVARENVRPEQLQGAGMVLRGSTGYMYDCVIESNETLGSGAGIYANAANFTIYHCIINSNRADRFGGGVLITNHSIVDVTNCIILDNSAGENCDGGGVAFTSDGRGTVSNCDIIDNEALGMGGGVYSGSDSFPVIIDCILWGNEAGTGDQIFVQDNLNAQIEVSYCCIEGGVDEEGRWDGEEIIDEDPELVEGRDPEWGFNGYYLDPESPCIDTGSAAASDVAMDSLSTMADLSLDEDMVDLGFHYSIWSFRIIGRLYGTVITAADDEPIEGVLVTTSYGQTAWTDDEGAFEIAEAVALPFSITAVKDGYNPATVEDLDLEEGGETEVEIRMTRPVFTPSENMLGAELGYADSEEIGFRITNDGDGLLEWQAVTQIGEDHRFNAWELRDSLPFGETLQDDRIFGVVMAGDRYYLSGANGDDPNLIYVLDRMGEPYDRFEQQGDSRYGLQDLAWDGENLWGSGDRAVYCFTPDGDQVESFDGPADPNTGLAWDTNLDLLWVCGTAGDIVAYDRNGERQRTIADPNLRIYGLAYWGNDPDGYNLYANVDIGGNQRKVVYKFNTDNGDVQLVHTFEGDDHPYGSFITSGYDPYNWVLMTVPRGENLQSVEVWELAIREEWMSIEPTEGSIEPEEFMDLTLTLNSTGFPGGVFEGEACFTHNAMGGQTILPVMMEVTEGQVHMTFNLDLNMGWNLVSVYLEPDEPDVVDMTRELVDAGLLLYIKDQDGNFYAPEQDDFNNIEGWSFEQGYSIKMRQPGRLSIEGLTVAADTTIHLRQGWQILSYLPRWSTLPEDAFAGLGDNMVLAKDGEGRFYLPAWDFNSIDRCRVGKGYKVKVIEETDFVWAFRGDEELNRFSRPIEDVATEHFPSVGTTGCDMSLLVTTRSNFTGEVALWAGERLVGSGVVKYGRCGIAVRGDDPCSPAVEGARNGDRLRLTAWNAGQDEFDLECSVLAGDLVYATDGYAVVEFVGNQHPEDFGLLEAYPNPFNSQARVSFYLPQSDKVTLSVFDIAGREVVRLSEGFMESGHHSTTFDAKDLSSGVYFVRMKSSVKTINLKMICIR